jgi:alanyl-tRNA synthetase
MQQHTGQHILSAAFDRLHRARTVGFHLGAVLSTLDLDKVLGAEALAAAESEANRIVWENRPVSIRFATPEEAAAMSLRKEPARSGPLRVIEVEDFDMSACGGTHVARTGQVGVIALRSWEKFRGGMRLEFACGGRALREFRVLRDSVAGSLRLLSVAPPDLPAAIAGAQADNKTLRRSIRDLGERLAVHEAAALVGRARPSGAARVVVEALDGWDQAGLKALASAAASRPGVVAALVSAGEPALVVIARAADVAMDAAAVLKALVGRFGGNGGGKPDLAQGGGLAGGPGEIVAALNQLIESALRPAP